MSIFCAVRLTIASGAVAFAISGCSRSAQTFEERGDAAAAKGDTAAAVLEYRNAIGRDPLLASAHQKLADAYLAQGNDAGAVGEYVRAADLLSRDVGAQVKAGTVLGLAGRFEDAKARAEKALSLDPNSVDALVLRANATAGLKDLDGALEQLQQALRLEPRSSIQTNLGAIHAMRGNQREAEAAFRQAVATDPKSVSAQIALGQFLWGAGKPVDAESAFKAALAIEPGNALANGWLGDFYLRSGREAEAETYLVKAAQVSKSERAQFALADYLLRSRRPGDAVAVLEEMSGDPRYWAGAKVKLAEIQFGEGKKEDAYGTVNAVIKRVPSMAQARVVRGQFMLTDGRVDEALADGAEAAKLDAQNLAAHLLLGAAHEAKRDLDAAASAYREALRLNPSASAVQVRLARVELNRNALPLATELAEQASSAQPGNLAAQLVLAQALLVRGDVTRATAVIGSLEKRAPNHPAVQIQVGRLALATGDKRAARVAFERASSLDELALEPVSMLVSLDLEEKKTNDAVARVESRLQQAPKDNATLMLAGRTWITAGDAKKGEALLRRAIEFDVSNLEAYSDLARLYLAQRRMDEAVTEFDRLAEQRPRAVGPQTMAALIRQAQGNEADAQKRYERIVDTDPRAAVASNNLAWMYASRNEQLDRALQLAQAAKTELPDHPEVNDTLAFVYLKKRLPALAIPPLRLAVEKDPKNPLLLYHLGLAYSQTGAKASARQALEQALTLKPDFDGAAEARRVLASLN